MKTGTTKGHAVERLPLLSRQTAPHFCVDPGCRARIEFGVGVDSLITTYVRLWTVQEIGLAAELHVYHRRSYKNWKLFSKIRQQMETARKSVTFHESLQGIAKTITESALVEMLLASSCGSKRAISLWDYTSQQPRSRIQPLAAERLGVDEQI